MWFDRTHNHKSHLSSENNPEILASFRHYNCKKTEEEIAKALQSNNRKDYLFALNHELEIYEYLQDKITECDKKIDEKLNEIIDNDPNKSQHYIDDKPYKRINKNTPKNIDINLKSFQMFERIDLLAIEGMSYSTVLSILSEVGIEGIRKFPSAKHFTSWLRLAPNNKISGGKVLSSKVPKGSSRLKIALRKVCYWKSERFNPT